MNINWFKKTLLISVLSLIIIFLLVNLEFLFNFFPPSDVVSSKWDAVKNKINDGTVLNQIKNGTIDIEFENFFNRDPDRYLPSFNNIIVSPADGIIKNITENPDNYTIVISINLSDVHVQRIPISGKIISVEKMGKENTSDFQVTTTIGTKIGIVTVTQRSGKITRKILTFVKLGDQVSIGDKLGRIMLGSTAIIVLPKNIKIIVYPTIQVYAGTSILAKYYS